MLKMVTIDVNVDNGSIQVKSLELILWLPDITCCGLGFLCVCNCVVTVV
jgi:hypothetical protein